MTAQQALQPLDFIERGSHHHSCGFGIRVHNGNRDQRAHLSACEPHLVQSCPLESDPEQASAEHRGHANRCGDPQNLAPWKVATRRV